MALRSAPLSLLTFPQHWDLDTGTLSVRFVCLPNADPGQPLVAGQPTFAGAALQFEAWRIAGLGHLPRSADASSLGQLALLESPEQKSLLFPQLGVAGRFTIRERQAAPLLRPQRLYKKPLTDSYRELVGKRALSPYLVSGDEFECALHAAHDGQAPQPQPPAPSLTWGQIIALALRQPKLATQLGLVGEAQIHNIDPGFFARGGWLYIALHADSDYAAVPALTSLQAARIPPLDNSRSLYTPLLFPVDEDFNADDVYREAERYERGFARMVHGTQGQEDGDAIRLAWDDEQIAEWLNRQRLAQTFTPMGTRGYRVDVRDAAVDDQWHSLQRVQSIGELRVGPLSLGPHEGEGNIDVLPAAITPARPHEFWMPPYFAIWRGASLVLTDAELTALHQSLEVHPDFEAMRLGREQSFVPVGDKEVPLRYGHSYEFRVRLADLSHGGPPPGEETPDDASGDARHTTTIAFRRHRRPGRVEVLQAPTRDEPTLRVARPRLGYPEYFYTDAPSWQAFTDALIDDAAAGRAREPGLPDPDVVKLDIAVEVRTLAGDRQAWQTLYRTARDFAGDELVLRLELQDPATLDAFSDQQPVDGPLAISTAREIRLQLTAVGRADAGYFADDAARQGHTVSVELRAEARAEAGLFAPVDDPLRSFFFRMPPVDGSVPRPAERLAQELGLDHQDLTLAGRAGQRSVMACSASLRHTLSPERASITFSSDADVVQRWIQVLRLKLGRDWTWRGLAEAGIAVRRRIVRGDVEQEWELAGTIRLPASLAPNASVGSDGRNAREPQRQFVELLFFDAVDPKPRPGEFPTELTVEYDLVPTWSGELPPPAAERFSVRLPVATPPTQVPRLVSAGIALSPFDAAGDYSSTTPRERHLWLEFERPPDDPGDAYFVRMLAVAPDPLLLSPTEDEIPEVVEPPLPIDPEWMRLIFPRQPCDDSGARAMQHLSRRSDSGVHCLIPLPDGMSESSLELFGLFTCEIRVGHADTCEIRVGHPAGRWCTAHGRYGPPLRVAGMQHPPPPLVCEPARTPEAIVVRAPFATPVHQGRHLRPSPPQTSLWALLYARVEQGDGRAWRNLLLLRAPLAPPVLQQLGFPFHGFPFPRRVELSLPIGPLLFGEGRFPLESVQGVLRLMGLPDDVPLTTLAVELFGPPDPDLPDPLGGQLGEARMLRVSPLVPVPDAC